VFKTIALMPRRLDLSRDFFQDYYESHHAPLALRYIHCFVRYARNHVVLAEPEVWFDTLSEFWFESVEVARALIAWHATPAADMLHEDEARFLDRERVIALPVAETVVFNSTRSAGKVPLKRETLLFASNRSQEDELGSKFEQLAYDWARRDDLERVCLDLPLSTVDVLPDWALNTETVPSALLTGWRREARTRSSAPVLPPGAAALGCTHHLVMRNTLC
jgi:hypothetical protein